MISQMQKKIATLERELENERSINSENQTEMDRLMSDIQAITDMGTSPEFLIQKKLNTISALYKEDKIKLEHAERESRRLE